MILIVIVMELMIREELEDKRLLLMRYSRKVIFDSSMSLSLHMPHKIGTMVDELVEIVESRFHIDDGLLEVVQHMMQLRMILHVK